MCMAMPAMFFLLFSLSSSALAPLSNETTSTYCNPLCPPWPERKLTRVRQRAPRAAQAMPITAWARPRARHGQLRAPPAAVNPGPLSLSPFTKSLHWTTSARQTCSMPRASTLADDQLADIPRPCRQTLTSRSLTRSSPT
jgi:hypothetical protein